MYNIKVFIFFLFFLTSTLSQAQVITYVVLPDSKLSVSGTSTMHDWNSKVNTFSGSLLMKKAVSQRSLPKTGDVFDGMELRIDVKSIESGRGSVMDNRTYDALKADTHPEIVFLLKQSKVTNTKNETGVFKMVASGDVTIAGVTKTVEMEVEGQKLKNGNFRFTGSKPLKMTEFNITPPTAMFGQIVTGEEVTIIFDLYLGQKK